MTKLSFIVLLTIILFATSCSPKPVSTPEREGDVMDNQHNRLVLEKSPYLLQHADNPVDWYPWGEEAFEEATKKDKPIFLSIGYSTCHWCHVMEHESFEDEEVAKLMNEVFVSIKVDREERPDIDNLYMTVAQMMTGRGGWPLNIIMTPDKKPFYAATYIPKETLGSQIGMLDLIPQIKEMWATRRADLVRSAEQITSVLRQIPDDSPGSKLNESTLDRAYEQLAQRFDSEHGGFSSAPKFPTPHQLFFLLRYWKRTGNDNALYMVEKTLQQMSRGGIYDHVGFGFHRYSTDSKWLVPHFEKMLYDQALLSMVYTEAYQATGKEEYAKTAKEILTYVLRDMTFPDGGFYSGEDADSEGEEGKFYLWTYEEIEQLLSKDELETVVRVYNIEKGGNFLVEATGQKSSSNILHMNDTLAELAAESRISEQELQSQLELVRHKLFTYREKRVHPHKDDKILADWNGLMIAALAKAARVFDEPQYTMAAEQAVGFIIDYMRTSEGRLLHRYRDGQAAITSHIDDYAFLIWGLLELYETTFEPGYLKMALELNDDMIEHFWDDIDGGFYFTADDAEDLLVRQKDIYDGAIPSGNSVAMLNLILLSRITAHSNLEDKAVKVGEAFSGFINDLPISYTQLLAAVDYLVGPSYEVIIAGTSQASDTLEMLRALWNQFIPSKVVILKPTEQETPEIINIAPYVSDYVTLNGKATAYVCFNYLCSLPTTDVDKMLEFFNVRQP